MTGTGGEREAWMGKRTTLFSLILIVGALALLCLGRAVARAQDAAQARPQPRIPELSRLVIPQELGHVSHIQPAAHLTRTTKTLILIQDAHVNYEAQQHLAGILDRLAAEYGIRLVLVEGGYGDLSLSSLRGLGGPAARKRVADRYLQSGLISGEEYLQLVSDRDLQLWGVEDPALYDQAMALFLETEQIQQAAGQPLERLRRLIEQVRAQIPNEPLRAFEARRTAFEREELAFSAYLTGLAAEAERVDVALAQYPTLQRMLTVIQLEQSIEQEQLEREQRDVLEEIRRRADQAAVAKLLEAGRAIKAGTGTPEAFYQLLGSLMDQLHLAGDRVPQLSAYIRYVSLKEQAPSDRVLTELHALQEAVKQRLLTSPEEAGLIAMAEGVASYEELLHLRWSPEGYRAYQAHQDEWRVSRWLPVLQGVAARLQVPWTWEGDAEALDRQLQRPVRFYEASAARDEAIVQRTLEKLNAEGVSAAALIVGGFHTDQLRRLLAARGIQLAVVTPWVGKDTEDDRYRTVLKAKYRNLKAKSRMPATASPAS